MIDMQYRSSLKFFDTVCKTLEGYPKPRECDEIVDDFSSVNFFWLVVMLCTTIICFAIGLAIGIKHASK